jgi:hypothetical protein
MAYTLKTSETSLVGGKNILASEHLQFIEAGITLDATKFPTGANPLGLLIARNTTSGKFEPAALLATAAAHDNFAVLNIDFVNDGVNDLIAGEAAIRGSFYLAKLPAAPNATFRANAPMIRFVSHV